MTINYDEEPFSKLSLRLRDWLEQTIQRAENDERFSFWRAVLPAGSSVDDAIMASQCILRLFPERVHRERNTPVDTEFVF